MTAMMNRRREQREKALLTTLEPLIHQEVESYKNGGTYVVAEGGRKIRLSTAKAKGATAAGIVYYEQLLGVKFPAQYSYNQSLEQDRFIRGYNGKRIQVRRRGPDGKYTILPAGVDFFKFHRSFWHPLFPRRILRTKPGGVGYELVDASSGWDYVSLTLETKLTSATLRQAAGDPTRPVFATEDQQRQEVIALAKQHVETLDEVEHNGVTYRILYHGSMVDHVYDPSKPILVDRQLTVFENNQPPTVETIINRPIRAHLLLSDQVFRPYDLHPDSFKSYEHSCVVQMLYRCMSRRCEVDRIEGKRRYVRKPILSIGVIISELHICFEECGFVDKQYPFAEGGWQLEGANLAMVIRFAERQTENLRSTAVTIFHVGYKIFEHVPPKAVYQIVCSVQGAHAYFYKTCMAAVRQQELHDRPLKDHAYTCIQVREPFEKEYGRPFVEWQSYLEGIRPYLAEGFASLERPKRTRGGEKILKGEARYFWTKDDNLQEIYTELKVAQTALVGTNKCFSVLRSYANDPEKINGLTITAQGLPRFVIRVVPLAAEILCAVALKAGFIYSGQSIAKFGDDLRVHCFKRCKISASDRRVVEARQGGRCALCSETGPLELDHKIPLSTGGSDQSLDNMNLLCLACHRVKTSNERHAYGSMWSSTVSRDVMEGLICSPPPRQLVWGDGCEGWELDVCSSRPYGLQKQERLPICDVCDHFEEFNTETFRGCDFVYIDAGPCNASLPDAFCCYAGPRWYTRKLGDWILSHKVRNALGVLITTENFGPIFKAHQHTTGRAVELVFDRMRELIDASIAELGVQSRPYASKLGKLCILAMLGRWNTKVVHTWKCCEVTTRDDAPMVVHRDRKIDETTTKYMTQYSTLSMKTMALFSLVALNQEHLECCRAIQLARQCRLNIHGTVVDSVLVSGTRQQMEHLKAATAALLRKDGSNILQVKDQRIAPKTDFVEWSVEPTTTQWRAFEACQGERRFKSSSFGSWFHNPRFAYKRPWKTLEEEEGVGTCDEHDLFQDSVAATIVREGRGCLLEGRGGVGKSRLLACLIKRFEAAGYAGRVVSLATTHVASAVVEGETILSHLHRASRSKRLIVIVDELSMVSLATFGHLSEALLVGCVFVVCGDSFQLPPIGVDAARWQTVMESAFLHDMCGGLRVKLRKFRRRQATADPAVFLPGDFLHFSRVGSLYPIGGDEDPTEAIRQAREWYPYNGEEVDVTLCLTNKRRIRINERENARLAPPGAMTCVYEGVDPRAQSMRLWPGLVLSGGTTDRKLGIRHALTYTVETVDADWCTVRRGDESIMLETGQVAGAFRLRHAMTIDSSQALTLQGRVLIVEASHAFFQF